MAEGLLGGILGEEADQPEVEAPHALAGAEAFASAVAAELGASSAIHEVQQRLQGRQIMRQSYRLSLVRNIAITLLLLPPLIGAAVPLSSADVPTRHNQLRAVADGYWQFYLRESPEAATGLGEYQNNARWTDYSLAHVAVVRKRAADLLRSAQAVDTTGLADSDRLDQQLLVGILSDQLESIRLKNYEMPIDQFNGPQVWLPAIVTVAPFDSIEHYRDYIARLNSIPVVIDQVIEASRAGLKDGLIQPRFLLEQTVAQCAAVADAAGASNAFAEPVNRIPASFAAVDRRQLRDAIITAVDLKVRPAYTKLKVFIASEYAPRGRASPGLWALPDGAARYGFAIHTQTTTELSGAQAHELGLAQVAEVETQIDALAKSAGYADRPSFEKAIHADPKTHNATRQQILHAFTHYVDQMELKLPELFGLLPKSKLIVTSVPSYMEKENSTRYIPGTPDGSRPGQIWVDTYDFATHDLLDDECTAYHEGVPGHHMQISIAQELPGLHPFHRILSNNYNAYVEGWALYAERLGKEVGFYQDPASDLGRLHSELFRAMRVVLDTGVHEKRWSRQQMVEYWNAHLPPASDAEIDRYIAWPAQALGYKLGQLKILELRQRAQTELGLKFDIRAFHDEVLNAGALPLDVLETRIAAWIATTKSAR